MLLTLANSPAFVRAQPIASLSQAIMVLGYARLVKWLVLLLVIASKDTHCLPAIYAAVARGFCMEYAAAATGGDRAAQDNGFVVGAFSLLDVITGQPAPSLFSQVPLPVEVIDALVSGTGPHAAGLALAKAFEGDDAAALDQAAAALHLPRGTANGLLLRALAATDALQTLV